MPRRLLAIFTVSFGGALVIIDGAIATVALPTIARDLHVDSSAAVLVITVYQLVLLMTLLPFSALGDRIGHSRLYARGLMVFTVATVLCFFARSLPFLLIVRAVQALGAAAVLSVLSALIRAIYPPDQLGRGLGINTVVVTSAATLAPTLGGFILAVAPWPWVFAAAAPFGLISLLLSRALPAPERRAQPYDVIGALLCAMTFGLTISGLESAVHGDSPVISAAIVGVGLSIGFGFVRRELRTERPIMPVDLLGRPVLALSVLGAMAAFIASMTVVISLPFRLQQIYGFSPSEVGTVMAAMPLTMLFAAPAAGALSDRFPVGILGGIGMSVATMAMLSLAYLPTEPSHADLAARLAILGLGYSFYMSPNARLIIGSTPRERAAAAGGLIATNRLTGQTLGATLAAILLALGLGRGPAPALVAAGLLFIAGLCSLARLNPALRTPQKQEIPDL
jgi:DHA2 family multidrug resistance protein-like MFS transporter